MEQLELIEKAAIKLDPISLKLIQEPRDMGLSRGGVNTVYHQCDIRGARHSYASCLQVIDQAIDGVNEELRPECHVAVKNHTCPAMKMRMAELKAGRALFFVDYRELTAERQRLIAETEPEILFGRRAKEAAPRGKFVPTVFDKKGQPIFDKVKAAEVEIKTSAGPNNDKFKAKPKTKIERVGNSDETNIMQKVLEKRLNDGT